MSRAGVSESRIQTDILIIGGGFGGLFAAIKACENGAGDVVVVDKGVPNRTAMSNFAAGAVQAVLPNDDHEKSFLDMLQGQEGIARVQMTRSIGEESMERIADLGRYGIEFARYPWGRYRRLPSRGLKYIRFLFFPHDEKGNYGGSAIVDALYRRAKKLGVRFVDRVFITDILVKDNRAVGAVGIHRKTGEILEFNAKAVILAAATNSFRGNYACVQMTTGSSYALAYKAGARLMNMEFFFTNTGSPRFWLEGTGPATRFGAKFRNAHGEAFMGRYEPVLKDKADAGLLSRGMAREVLAGNGPISFSFGMFGKAISLLPYMRIIRKFGGWMPVHLDRLKENGINIFKRSHEWMPVHHMHMGGIVTGMDCMSSVQGLFAAGDCQGIGVGGFNGACTAHCYWSGHHAGVGAADYVANASPVEARKADLDEIKDRLSSLQGRGGRLTPEDVIKKLQETVIPYNVSILKREDRLKKALEEVESIREELLPAASVPDLHQLIKLEEAGNMVLSAEMFLRASMVRKESRKDHYREDYPARDDDNWLKFICLEREEGEMLLSTEPIEVDRSLLTREI